MNNFTHNLFVGNKIPVSFVCGAGCPLNFSSSTYVPTGECNTVQETISNWQSFPTTLCCRNALTILSQALSLQARNSKSKGQSGSLFLPQDEWNTCSDSFQPQHGVSMHSCGFDGLYYNSTQCSSFSLQDIVGEEKYKNALNKCSHFDNAFDEACANCTVAILDVREVLLENSEVNNDESIARATCGVAAVISVAAGNEDDPALIDKFFRCLPTLDELDPDYFKVKYSLAKVIFAILIAMLALTLLIMLVKYVTKKKPRKPVQLNEINTSPGLYIFSKAEIAKAINHRKERKSLGRGSAGQVYKGVLPSGQVVAIKHIFKSNKSNSFTREVEGLSRVRHPHLVCLFGFCIEDGEQYLVYEYCPEGNLAQHLLRTNTRLTWDKRVKILRDCAQALWYLHHHIEGCIVHRDIKLTNILLTEKLEPKLSDFGLAKMLGMEESKVFTDVRGTIGYMDPEYMTNAKLTCASDVYSFGIVALQLLSGQKVIELDLDARDQLTRKARDVNMGKRPLTDFEDPRLNGKVNKTDFNSILKIAVLCVAKSSKGRPTIDVVLEEMDKAWNNSVKDKEAKLELGTSAMSMSTSLEVIPV
ncbi:Tyrosine kinase family protein [Quillaja saponaria]|uniref:non-specific serine/threonine protein kinase n=1 Tax=Quillaja saponaria TaxID=32244 RepID=A0AAD7Q2G6_QUISA|nr:Tyrosine kinase family protein [Quillaja saponaria]